MAVETLSLDQFLQLFPDAQAARTYIESIRGPEDMYCVKCGATGRVRPRGGTHRNWYRCYDCKGE